MEWIEVTARWQEDGQVAPLRFLWKKSHFNVESIGRTWTDVDGLHVLVQSAGGRTFELVFHPQELRWSLQLRAELPQVL